MATTRCETDAWTRALPRSPGHYDYLDPLRCQRSIVEVRRVAGTLAVRIPRGDGWMVPLVCWRRPCLRQVHWRGPIRVPAALPPPTDADRPEPPPMTHEPAPTPRPAADASPLGLALGSALWLLSGLGLMLLDLLV